MLLWISFNYNSNNGFQLHDGVTSLTRDLTDEQHLMKPFLRKEMFGGMEF